MYEYYDLEIPSEDWISKCLMNNIII